ncbi:MAG: O-antigen ligase family protein [Candidatus Flexifilum sp.]|jgi:O-antigen ligase
MVMQPPARPAWRSALERALLHGEPIALAIMLGVFWFLPLERVFALLLAIPVLIARLLIYRRPYAVTALYWPIMAFCVLAGINILFAPYGWGPVIIGRPLFELRVDYDVLVVGRPLLGMLLALTLADRAARRDQVGQAGLIGFGLLVGALALVGSQWTEKSVPFAGLIERLPALTLPDFRFNVNEIGGALAWLIPVMLGIAWTPDRAGRPRLMRAIRRAAWLAFGLQMLALYLGQSRLAIIGVIGALFFQIRWTLPAGRKRHAAYLALAAFAAAQALVFTPALNPRQIDRIERDEDSLNARLEIYAAAGDIIRDHPLTGVGMNAFRAPAVRADYYVPGWDRRVLPHAHNELLQIGADLGLPGMIWLALVYALAGRMLWIAYRRGDSAQRTLAAAVGAGLIAHGLYGVGDAIALWDRFSFVFWWLIGLAAGLHAQVTARVTRTDAPSSGAVVDLQADAVQRARLV